MFIVLGATGHVGSAVASTLLEREQPVTVVTRDAAKGAAWKKRGAEVAVVDVRDARALHAVLAKGERLFLLNPPADPATDTVKEERATMRALVAALEGSGLRKIVAQSTYGAQPGDAGDLGVLHEMEQAVRTQRIPVGIVRGAYFMSNFDLQRDAVVKDGVLHTLFPADFVLPMVAPADLGRFGAELLMAPPEETGLHHVEGPLRHSARDVAAAFARALGRPVEVKETPPEDWQRSLRNVGFSDAAAASFAAMTRASLETPFPALEAVKHGPTSLDAYVKELVNR